MRAASTEEKAGEPNQPGERRERPDGGEWELGTTCEQVDRDTERSRVAQRDDDASAGGPQRTVGKAEYEVHGRGREERDADRAQRRGDVAGGVTAEAVPE